MICKNIYIYIRMYIYHMDIMIWDVQSIAFSNIWSLTTAMIPVILIRFFPPQEKDEPRYHGQGELTERDTGVLLKRTTFILTLQVLIHWLDRDNGKRWYPSHGWGDHHHHHHPTLLTLLRFLRQGAELQNRRKSLTFLGHSMTLGDVYT